MEASGALAFIDPVALTGAPALSGALNGAIGNNLLRVRNSISDIPY